MTLKVGVVSQYNPETDKSAHSGILFMINQSLKKAGYETIWIENKKSFWYTQLGRIPFLLRKIGIRKFMYYFDRTHLGVKLQYSTMDLKKANECDFIVAIHYFHVPLCVGIEKPVVYHSDAVFELVNDYYLHDVSRWNALQAEKIEQIALDKSWRHLSSSYWRHNSLLHHYKQNPSKCAVLLYGPCMDVSSLRHHKYDGKELRILFMGVDWIRKGGDIAVETVSLLNKRGIKSKLTIVGIKEIPKICQNKAYIEFLGFLNKNEKSQYDVLKRTMENTDLFLLPTKAECSGVVFSEAESVGIPVLTYDTGGVGSYVIDGKTGYRLTEGASAKDFADKIEYILNENLLEDLSVQAKKYAKANLNWDNWTKWFSENLK